MCTLLLIDIYLEFSCICVRSVVLLGKLICCSGPKLFWQNCTNAGWVRPSCVCKLENRFASVARLTISGFRYITVLFCSIRGSLNICLLTMACFSSCRVIGMRHSTSCLFGRQMEFVRIAREFGNSSVNFSVSLSFSLKCLTFFWKSFAVSFWSLIFFCN